MTLTLPEQTVTVTLPVTGIQVAPVVIDRAGKAHPVCPSRADTIAVLALHDGAEPTVLSADHEDFHSARAHAAELAEQYDTTWSE